MTDKKQNSVPATSTTAVKTKATMFEIKANEAKAMFLAIADEKVWKRELGFALQILRANGDIFSSCDPESIKNAIFNIAATGTTLNPVLKEAYLIPRKIKGRLRCCLDFDYRGLVKIATDTGSVLDIDATVVHSNDIFHYEMGLNPRLEHIPSLDEDPGPMVFVYAIATLHNGIKKFLVLNRADVEKVRKTSQAKDSELWTTWYDEACKKTAVRKLAKLLPRTDRFALAVTLSNEAEAVDFNPPKPSTATTLMQRFGHSAASEQEANDGATDSQPPAEEESVSEEEELFGKDDK